MNCPNCGFKIPAKVKGTDKRLAEDQGKAQAAMDALDRRMADRRFFADLSVEGFAGMQENGQADSVF